MQCIGKPPSDCYFCYVSLVKIILLYYEPLELTDKGYLINIYLIGNDEDANKSSLQNEVNIMMRKQAFHYYITSLTDSSYC